jgi:hypothetical protein
MKTALIAFVVIVLLVGVGVGAYMAGQNAGLTQAQNIRTEFFQSRQGGQAQGQGQGQGQGARQGTAGTVKSVQGNTLEITQRDGSTVTVTIGQQTLIEKTVSGTTADLTTGENVTVVSGQGTSDPAQAIVIQPARPQGGQGNGQGNGQGTRQPGAQGTPQPGGQGTRPATAP